METSLNEMVGGVPNVVVALSAVDYFSCKSPCMGQFVALIIKGEDILFS